MSWQVVLTFVCVRIVTHQFVFLCIKQRTEKITSCEAFTNYKKQFFILRNVYVVYTFNVLFEVLSLIAQSGNSSN